LGKAFWKVLGRVETENEEIMTYKPTQTDIDFIKHLFKSLSVGGIWGYKSMPVLLQKIDNKTLAVVLADENFPGVREQVEINKAVVAAAGLVFSDNRPGK